MSFHVGQRVVCIKEGGWSHAEPGERHPQKGEVLTIRNIDLCPDGTFLQFAEIVNPQTRVDFDGLPAEAQYWSERFRPIDERRLDIFRALLVSPPKEVVQA